METESAIHNTFVLERSYPNPTASVFAAFADPATKRRWFAEGHTHHVEEYEMDFRIGGAERARYRFKEGTPFPGVELSNNGQIHDIVPGRRIVSASTMSLGRRPISVALVTFEFLETERGTDLICTHQAVYFEGSDGPQIREAGWGKLFENLGKELTR